MDELETGGPAELHFEVTSDDRGCPVVRLEGELDMTNADALQAAVEPVLEQAPPRLVVDLSALKFADSSGVALWVRWANVVEEVELRRASPLLRRVLERMGLAERLHVS